MKKPIVALVGRPNVGKSTIFNRLVGKKIAITNDNPGITRDRLYGTVNYLDYSFHLIDTGGIDIATGNFNTEIKGQAELAIDEADIVVFVVDGKEGLTANDYTVRDILKKSGKPVIVAINKTDSKAYEEHKYDFYDLAFDNYIELSAEHNLGISSLLDEITKNFKEIKDDYEEEIIKFSIIGRPNVGKSSLVNALLNEERVIVSPVAGTTRDAIDTPFNYDDKEYMIIDTAGIRKRGKIYENIEKYSILRAMNAIERSNVVLFVIDGELGIREQDKHVAGLAHEAGKGVIIVYNKWDTVEKDEKTMNKIEKEIRAQFVYLDYAPIAFTSALTHSKVNKLLPLIDQVHDSCCMRIMTNVLNDVILDAQMMNPPKPHLGKQLRIYYASQVSVEPPTIVLFVNDPDLLHFSYSRYIENKLREAFGFIGTPIRIIARKKS